jgi:hypothetical protein
MYEQMQYLQNYWQLKLTAMTVLTIETVIAVSFNDWVA